MFKQLLILFFLFLTFRGYGQNKKLDTVQLNLSAFSIDSAEASGRNIGDYILRKYRHTGYHVEIHYIIDTVSNVGRAAYP